MTVGSAAGTPSPVETAAVPAASVDVLKSHDRKLVRGWLALSMGVLFVVYALLMNPYWVPGGDSDFYVAIARNLALRGEYSYNGLPTVALSPPGWPYLMSWVMKLSPTFFSLKLVTAFSMLAALGVSYFILLRFAPPRVAALTVMLTGILMPVCSLTYFLHSDATYCLISAIALLLAFRIREGRSGWPAAVLLVALCVAIPYVRWAGVLQWLPIVAVLLSGRWSGGAWRDRRWVLALVCFAVIVSTWYAIRKSVELTKDQRSQIIEAGGPTSMDPDGVELPPEGTNPDLVPIKLKEGHTVFEEYGQRFLRSGKWFSWLIWYPARFAAVSKPIDNIVTVIGWGVIALLGYLTYRRARRGELIWLAVTLYCGALCLNWPNANARYLVPVAPLIVGGVLLSLRDLSIDFPTRSFNWWKWARRGFVYSLLLCNLAMYGVDVIVMRSSNFYATFEAGQHQDLINIARYLDSLQPAPATGSLAGVQYQPGDGDIAINRRYENLGRIRISEAGLRAMVLLTDRNIRNIGRNRETERLMRQTKPPFSGAFYNEMRKLRSEWLLTQSPSVPWRVWHFRLPQSLYERLAKEPQTTPSGGWTLYFYDTAAGTITEQPVPPIENWPTRVPGM